jgi:hypothetical protein
MDRRSFLACLASSLALAGTAPLIATAEAQRWQSPEGNFMQSFKKGMNRREKGGAGQAKGPGGPGMRMRRRRRMMMRRQRMVMQRRGSR